MPAEALTLVREAITQAQGNGGVWLEAMFSLLESFRSVFLSVHRGRNLSSNTMILTYRVFSE